ncbi:MAG: SlyX family protein [Burkholderiales bacterium]|nr:MAG: SlyX family protein [Burkholderiales bacterium]
MTDTRHPAATAANHEHRLTRLEEKLAFAEDLLDTLNATVSRQQEAIELLARELVRLRRKQVDDDPDHPVQPPDERPPHY